MKQYDIKPRVFIKKHIPHQENANFNSQFKKEMLENRQKTIKRVQCLILTTAILTTTFFTTFFIVKKYDTSEKDKTSITQTSSLQSTSQGNTTKKENITIQKFGDKSYYVASPEYVLGLAQNSLSTVEKILKNIDGITPVGTNSGDFYPEYFNEYMLTSMAYCESSFRIKDTDGNPLKSNADALGMMQIRPQTLNDVNYWLKNTMGLDLQYSVEDLSDPQKSMDIATFILVQTCKNHGKEKCKNPIYPYLNEGFSIARQEEIILALYNNGYSNMMQYIENGTVFEYLSEGSSNNYVNKIMKTAEMFEEKYSQLT